MWVEKKHFHKNQTNREPDLSGQKKTKFKMQREREREREGEKWGEDGEREREREMLRFPWHQSERHHFDWIPTDTTADGAKRRASKRNRRRRRKEQKKTKTKQKQSSTWHPARPDGVSRRGVPAEHTHTHTHKTRAWPTFDWKEMAPCSFEDDNDVKKENRKAKVHVRRTVLEPADWHRPLWNSGT